MTDIIHNSVDICGISFKNPIIAASGTFGFGREYDRFYDIGILGGISTKGLTAHPREGNDSPRIAETASGMLNSVGLQNPGIRVFIENDLEFLRSKGIVVIANIAGNNEEDYIDAARQISASAVDMIELNISCPNVKEGGIAFGVYPDSVYNIVRAVRPHCKKPLIVKLSPNVADITKNAKACEDAGADCISLINTLTGLAMDYRTGRPVLANVVGGLSGPCVKPIALRMCYMVCNAVKIPVIGMGGIEKASDVIEFLRCGARAVMVGTQNIVDPLACKTIIEDLTTELVNCKITDVNDLVGTFNIRAPL